MTQDEIIEMAIAEVNFKEKQAWAGLTDEEMELTFLECGGKWSGDYWRIEDADFHPFLRTIEAKLKQKNGYAEENKHDTRN